MSHGHGGAAHSEEHHHGKPDRDLLDVISTLTHHLTGLGKDGSGGTSERRVGVVTLAGSNNGAVMKDELLDEAKKVKKASSEEAKLNAYANNNCQAVNNSIMIDDRCEAEDPGVDIEIMDCEEEEEEEEGGGGESSDGGGEHEKKKEKKGSLHEEK